MESFIYSLNATVPVFLVIVVGYCLKRMGMLNDNFVSVANTFNFNVALPVMLFCDIAKTNLSQVFNGRYVAFCIGATFVCFFVIWAAARFFIKDRSIIGSFVQGSFRGSIAVLGVAVMMNIYGSSGPMPLIIAFTVPFYNIFAVLVLTFEGEATGNGLAKVKSAIRNIVKNPLIIGIVLGLPFAYLGVSFPPIIAKTLSNFASMATPLALVVIGAGFEVGEAMGKLRPTLVASFIKLMLQVAVCLPVAVLMGFRGQELVSLLILLGAPTTPSSYIMAKNMGNDGVLASGIVVVTTLLSAVSVTFWIFVLRSLALI